MTFYAILSQEHGPGGRIGFDILPVRVYNASSGLTAYLEDYSYNRRYLSSTGLVSVNYQGGVTFQGWNQ